MAIISGTTLAIAAAPTSTSGRRRACIRYTIIIAGSDQIAGRDLTEHIIIRAVDRHDAPVGPRLGPVVEISRRFTATAGTTERTWQGEIARTDLDVEKDWWAPRPRRPADPDRRAHRPPRGPRLAALR